MKIVEPEPTTDLRGQYTSCHNYLRLGSPVRARFRPRYPCALGVRGSRSGADRDWSKARHAKVVEDLHGRLQDLEAALGDNEWIEGEIFTVGDLMLISVLGGLRGSTQLDRFPRLAAYVERGEAQPAHRKAMTDQLALYADLVPA